MNVEEELSHELKKIVKELVEIQCNIFCASEEMRENIEHFKQVLLATSNSSDTNDI